VPASWPLGVNVLNRVSVGSKVVGDHHAVALKPHTLCAHDRRRRTLSELPDILCCGGKLRCKHVICIVAEGRIPQRCVGRFPGLFSAPSAKFLFPEILDACLRQFLFQVFTIEMWMSPRHRERPNINQYLDAMRMQGVNQFL
jgi:hypothetical protein